GPGGASNRNRERREASNGTHHEGQPDDQASHQTQGNRDNPRRRDPHRGRHPPAGLRAVPRAGRRARPRARGLGARRARATRRRVAPSSARMNAVGPLLTPSPGPAAPGWEPAYRALWRTGELARRVDRALASLRSCRGCLRTCDVDRLAESLELLDGVIDIYMPDFKYWNPESAERYLKAADYPQVARARINEMYRQVGDLKIDEQGLAYRGVNIRHLVMPGALDETHAILRWIRDTLGSSAYVNLMDQYYPAGRVNERLYPELNRRLSGSEFSEARHIARSLGLTRLDERHPHRWLRPRLIVG